VPYLNPVMSGDLSKRKPGKLPKALLDELALQNLTYEEAIAGCDGIPPHQTLLKLLRGWRLLAPRQKAAWNQRAIERNLSGGDPSATN
jgi:hypothetical protein